MQLQNGFEDGASHKGAIRFIVCQFSLLINGLRYKNDNHKATIEQNGKQSTAH